MPHKTFFWFFFPTGLAMILFIGLPIVSSFFQSLHIENQQILMEVENCDPFGCTTNVRVDVEATEKLKEENPLGRFNGFGTYTDRNHLAFDEIKEAWNTSSSTSEFKDIVLNLPFYKAVLFTLTFCFAVTPPVIILGFIVALSINTLVKSLKGLAIFGAIFASFRPSSIIFSASVATTSALTGPDIKSQISFVTSMMLRPDLSIKEGFVVTPSTIPRLFNSMMASISAVSTKNFISLSLIGWPLLEQALPEFYGYGKPY